MRSTILFILLISSPAWAGNAFTFSQVSSGGGAFDSGGAIGSSLTTTMTGAVGSGHLLVAYGFWEVSSGSATGAISDTVNGSWTSCGSAQQGINTFAHGFGQVFYILSSASGSPTISLTTSGSNATTARVIGVAEYSYTGIASLDVACDANTYSTPVVASNLVTTNNITTITSNALVLGACIAIGNSCAVGTGYTDTGGMLATLGSGFEHKTQASPASGVNAPFAASTNGTDSILAILAFRATSGTTSNQFPRVQ